MQRHLLHRPGTFWISLFGLHGSVSWVSVGYKINDITGGV